MFGCSFVCGEHSRTVWLFLLTFTFSFLFSSFSFSQAPPQGINYQAVARDAAGNPLATQSITATFRIRQTTPSGTVVYRGTQNTITNQFGLFTSVIGQTGSDSGSFSTINWGADTFFLQVIVNGYNMGTTQFMSVPYALHAGSSPAWNLSGNTASFGQYLGTNNSLNLIFKTNNIERMKIDSATGFVGLNNSNPSYRLSIGGGGVGSSSIGLYEYNRPLAKLNFDIFKVVNSCNQIHS